MNIENCKKNKNYINDVYLKLDEVNSKLNFLVTKIKPESYEENKLLSGVCVAIKDNVSTKNIKTTASCKLLDNYYPVFDATIIEKLKKNGATILCKTSMDELAMGGTNLSAYTGPCRNPYDLNRISGGSSGGSAVSVSCGLFPVAIGSDTGDSIRKPASFNSIVGVKPTYGRISRYGIIPYASSLDHVGYFTTNVKDSALMLEVLSGRDDKDMTSSYEKVLNYSQILNSNIEGKKILVFKNVVDSIQDVRIKNMFNNVVEKLKEKKAIIKEVTFDNQLMRSMLGVYYIIANCEASANHANLDGIRFGLKQDGESVDEIMINTRTNGFSKAVKKRFIIGSYGLNDENQDKYFRKAQKIRRLIVDEVYKELKSADILLAPASPCVAPLINATNDNELDDEYLIADNHMLWANFSGCPSMTVPMGFIDNLPIGINLTANLFKEDVMFDVALSIEEITGLKDKVKENF